MKTANCTSCGAPVSFRSTSSILAVCDYCKSTLIRRDLDLENLGKMAELMEDTSPLQREATGRYKSIRFSIIGRIQLRYADGLWNEWHLLFDNQRTGWLSETSGQYVLTFPADIPDPLPNFDAIRLGHTIHLLGEPFEVANKESATCIAGEGELPFVIGAGYAAPVVDLTSERNFATLDYSETPPRVFIGEQVQLADLRMQGLKQRAAGKVAVKTFNCPTCAAPLSIRARGTESVACGACGSVVDVTNENYRVLSRFNAQVTHEPPLPLGGRGHLHGADYEVAGYLRRQVKVAGLPYDWSEYLLYGEQEGFRWLTEYQGHWNLLKTTHRKPSMSHGAVANNVKPVAHFLGTRYEHFQTARASVTYVLGEFYWKVKVGEQATITDFVAPPYILSAESTAKEKTWSVGQYVEPGEIETAFQPPAPLPAPRGVAPNQPCPWVLRPYWTAFGGFALAAFIIQIGFVAFAQHQTVYRNHFELSTSAPYTTEAFPLSGRTGNLVLKSYTNLDNNWVYLDMQLVEQNSGRHYQFGREISYYHGWDQGAWTEGSTQDEVTLSGVPAGQYYLEIAPEMESRFATQPISYQLEIVRDEPGWMNLLLTLLGLSVFPLIAWWRKTSFEGARWAESDYAPFDSGDDDE